MWAPLPLVAWCPLWMTPLGLFIYDVMQIQKFLTLLLWHPKMLFFLGLHTSCHKSVNPLPLLPWRHLWMIRCYKFWLCQISIASKNPSIQPEVRLDLSDQTTHLCSTSPPCFITWVYFVFMQPSLEIDLTLNYFIISNLKQHSNLIVPVFWMIDFFLSRATIELTG